MEIKKHGRKWFVEGGQEGWVFNRAFPTKWKAQIALEVFNQGRKVSHYYQEARKKRPQKDVR